MFPYPKNTADWQTAYTRDHAYRDSWKHTAFSRIFLLAGAIVIYYFVMLLLAFFSIISGFVIQIQRLIGVGIFVIILFSLRAIQSLATRLAKDLFSRLFTPPEYVDADRLIKYRSTRKIKLPTPLNKLPIFKFESVSAKEGRIDKEDTWTAWSALNLGGPISLTVFDGSAIYLERGNRFSRVVGPGDKAPFLEWFETIKCVVDLRPKALEGSFDVWTKDGIKVNLTVRMECRVGSPKREKRSRLVYPFDPIAVRKAVEHYSLHREFGPNTLEEHTWTDAAWGELKKMLPGYINTQMMDDLIIAEQSQGQILSFQATQELMKKLNDATGSFGVFVTDFQIKQIIPPPRISTQHKEFWSAEKQSRTTIIEGQTKAYAIRTREAARADAQRDLIFAIAEGLQKNPNKQFSESLLLSLAGILDSSLTEPQIRATLAKDTLETLEKLQKILDKP